MKEPKLEFRIKQQIDAFIEGMQRDELNDRWIDQIEDLLKGSEQAQRYYLDKMSLVGYLEYTIMAEATAQAYKRAKPDQLPQPENKDSRLKNIVLLAAMMMVALGLGYFILESQKVPQSVDVKLVEEENSIAEPIEDEIDVDSQEDYVLLAQDIESVWKNKSKPFRFTEGVYELESGRVQLMLNDGALVAIEGPAKFRIDSDTPIWEEGIYVFEKEANPEIKNIVIGNVKLNSLRGKIGFKAIGGKYSCTQLGGEASLTVPRTYAGVTSTKKLNRGQGIRWHEGMYIDGIIGSSSAFTSLNMAFKQGQELLANAHFEFPRMEQNGYVSPSGWNVKLFPSMMAKVNHTNVAGLKVSQAKATSNQWGLLLCERQADGTMYGSSFEQKVSRSKGWKGNSLLFHGKYKLDRTIPLKENLVFRCGFYSGVTQSEFPLVVKDIVVEPGDHKLKTFDVTYNSFVNELYQKELYVRVEIMVLGDYGKQGLLLDDLSLTILKD